MSTCKGTSLSQWRGGGTEGSATPLGSDAAHPARDRDVSRTRRRLSGCYFAQDLCLLALVPLFPLCISDKSEDELCFAVGCGESYGYSGDAIEVTTAGP